MNVVVCIKQVPEIERVRVGTASGKIILSEDSVMVNPFDECAITALTVRDLGL